MKITATKLTDILLMRKACESTMQSGESKMTLDKIYRCEHSPIRTQLFWVEMVDIPTFVSVHFSRHKIGVEHFVMSNRSDRGGVANVDRNSLVKHSMLINAQSLVNMARKRLCGQASDETCMVMEKIKVAVAAVDEVLTDYMVRECQYRNGRCPELRPCKNLWRAE